MLALAMYTDGPGSFSIYHHCMHYHGICIEVILLLARQMFDRCCIIIKVWSRSLIAKALLKNHLSISVCVTMSVYSGRHRGGYPSHEVSS
jgi:hypothetical protein